MNLQTIRQPNGDTLVIATTTLDDGSVTQIIRPMDDDIQDAITNLIKGAITPDELLEKLNEENNAQDRCENLVSPILKRVSNKLTTDGLHVFIDNETFGTMSLDTTLEDHLVKLIRQTKDEDEITGWANFTERLYTNVDETIRSGLFRWLNSQGWLTVSSDGRLIGYRGCDENAEGIPCSQNTGSAIVNGKTINGHIPNPVGAIVEMPRSMVEADPQRGCASGLHVGTLQYAKDWGNVWLLRVAVAPEDIISVPFECNDSKIRCCRFEVLSAERIKTANISNYENETSWKDYQNAMFDTTGTHKPCPGCYDGTQCDLPCDLFRTSKPWEDTPTPF